MCSLGNVKSMANEELVEKLEETGWLAEMPETYREKLLKQLREDSYEAGYLYLATVDFDTECIESFGPDNLDDINSYYKIIRLFAEGSWGLFTPTNIRDECDESAQIVHVGFDFDGERFEVTVPYQGDWASEEVYILVNKALESRGIPQRFIALPVLDQCIYAAFISPAVFDKTVASGAIPTFEELLAEEGF
jgi:hypothetical protein